MTRPNAEEYGVAGYSVKGRLVATQHVVRAPNGTLLFENDRKNGVDGVIIDWIGDGVIIMTADTFAALATMLCAKPFREQSGIGVADPHVTRPASGAQGGNEVPSRSDDSPAREAGDAR